MRIVFHQKSCKNFVIFGIAHRMQHSPSTVVPLISMLEDIAALSEEFQQPHNNFGKLSQIASLPEKMPLLK